MLYINIHNVITLYLLKIIIGSTQKTREKNDQFGIIYIIINN